MFSKESGAPPYHMAGPTPPDAEVVAGFGAREQQIACCNMTELVPSCLDRSAPAPDAKASGRKPVKTFHPTLECGQFHFREQFVPQCLFQSWDYDVLEKSWDIQSCLAWPGRRVYPYNSFNN